jgi:hypothetical protein
VNRPRFFADHNLDQQIVDGLLREEPTIEIIVARDIGLDRTPDPEILSHAAEEGWVVVTHDVNTMTKFAGERLARGEAMAGVIIVPALLSVGRAIEELMLIWSASEAAEWEDQVVFVPL